MKLEEIPQADPADRLTPGDIKEGIAALRKTRTELGFQWTAATGGVSALRKRWYKAMALRAGAQYALSRESLFSAWSTLRTVETCMQELALHHTPTFINVNSWDELVLPAPDQLDAMKPLRTPGLSIGGGRISGEALRMSGRAQSDAMALKASFDQMINAAGGLV